MVRRVVSTDKPDLCAAGQREGVVVPSRPFFAGATYRQTHKYTAAQRPHIEMRAVRRQHEPAGRPSVDHRPQVTTPDHHRRLGARRAVAALVSPGHSGPAARAQCSLTRANHRGVMWPHEIPDSGISHRNAGSGPRSGTEAGDISPVFAALEHAAGDFTTLGKNPLLEYSSPPSDTFSNLFCKEAFRGRMYTAGLRIIIQRYSYRYRCRVLIGQGRWRPSLTPAH